MSLPDPPEILADKKRSYLYFSPVILGESENDYDELVRRLTREQAPFDFIDELLVRDVADNQWELLRLRRLFAKVFDVAKPEAIARILALNALEFAEEYAAQSGSQFRYYEQKLASGELTNDSIAACALMLNASLFEGLDRRMAAAEIRRNQALDRLDERREHRSRPNDRPGRGIIDAPEHPPIAKL